MLDSVHSSMCTKQESSRSHGGQHSIQPTHRVMRHNHTKVPRFQSLGAPQLWPRQLIVCFYSSWRVATTLHNLLVLRKLEQCQPGMWPDGLEGLRHKVLDWAVLIRAHTKTNQDWTTTLWFLSSDGKFYFRNGPNGFSWICYFCAVWIYIEWNIWWTGWGLKRSCNIEPA